MLGQQSVKSINSFGPASEGVDLKVKIILGQSDLLMRGLADRAGFTQTEICPVGCHPPLKIPYSQQRGREGPGGYSSSPWTPAVGLC